MDGSQGPRGSDASRMYYGAVIWIVGLLLCWFVIGHWDQLPQLITSTMAALP
jgi:hypothetical protein